MVPTCNEPDLGDWLDTLRAHAGDAEVLIVDDSRAATRAELRDTASARGYVVVDGCAGGKGSAIREGFRAARGDVIVMLDADAGASALARIGELVTKARNGSDVVIAERHGRHAELKRVFLSAAFRWIQRLLIFHSARFRDTQCGFKAFRREAALELASRQTVFNGLFDVEYLYIALRRGMRVSQVPIEQWPESRPSHLNLPRFLRSAPFDLLRVKWNGFLGRYSA